MDRSITVANNHYISISPCPLIIVGFVLPTMIETQGRLLLISISNLTGVLYTLAWSLSFYPQTYHIFRKRSVSGLSLDFCSLNFVGFLSYSIYNLAFILSQTVREQYRQRHSGNENVVRWNDALFALHALFVTTVQVIQTLVYKRSIGQKVSLQTRMALLGIAIGSLATIAGCLVLPNKVQWIDFVLLMGYVKLGITFVKYIPQIRVNFTRKNTTGFRIEGVLLDVVGGVLSLVQLLIDSGLNNDWDAVTGDPAKLGLPAISFLYDFILMFQHYYLYTDREDYAEASLPNSHANERTRLLNGDGEIPREG